MGTIDPAIVARFSTAVGIELSPDRQALVAEHFAGLFEAAQALNARMSEPSLQELTPAVGFTAFAPETGAAS